MEKIFKLKAWEQIFVQALLLTWSFIVLFPLYLAVVNATKPSTGNVLASPIAMPPSPGEGRVYVWGPEGAVISEGTLLVHTTENGDQLRFEAIEDTEISQESRARFDEEKGLYRGRLELIARFNGEEGNLKSGAILEFVEPIDGVEAQAQVFGRGFRLGGSWTWTNFSDAWVQAEFGRYFMNSLIITVSTIVIVSIFGSMTSFVLARMPFTGSRVIFVCFLLGMIIPIRLALAPLYWVVQQLGLLNSLWSVILVLSAMTMPTAVFILTSFLKGVSPELEQAAKMDGASPFQIYYKVVLPLVKPSIATVCLLAFVWAWNEYFLPLIFLTDTDLMPLPRGLEQFQTQFDTQWHMMFAGILIMIVPTIVAFLLASKQFIQGLAAGGVKE